ncbi:hypothetical protein ACQP2T_60415 [Nonomuraea sp. CA-143628]|uniref:hypothetical protein n=1 Tax=Nonomuraea sp. CA-143628 TaxID=3239997 RepID=UPI003D8A9A66
MDGEGLPEPADFKEFQREFGDRPTGDVTREKATLIGSYAGAVVTTRTQRSTRRIPGPQRLS